MENVLLETKQGTLYARGGNLEQSVTASMQAEGDMRACIPFVRLKELINTLKGDIDIEADATAKRCTVTWGKNKYKLTCESADEYPAYTDVTGEEITVDAEALLAMFSHVRFATSTDELRPAMMGVNVDLKTMHAVTTDGHKLSEWRDGDTGITVPGNAVDVAMKIFKTGELTVTTGEQYLTISDGAQTLTTRLIEDPYPNYKSVIPELSTNIATVDRALLLENTRRVMLFSNSLTKQVRLNFAGLFLTITAEDVDKGGEARDEMPITYGGVDMMLGVNGGFLCDALSHIDAKWVEIYLTSPSRAMLIKAANKEEPVTMLVMPVRLND